MAALPTPTRDGYTFQGWYTDDKFASGSEVKGITTTDTGDKTFYAKWTSQDTSIMSVTIGTENGTVKGEQITVTLPHGSTLPPVVENNIKVAAGASLSELKKNSESNNEARWSFTVTAEDGKTKKNYTLTVKIAPDPKEANKKAVEAAKSKINGARAKWIPAQKESQTKESLKTFLEGKLKALPLGGVQYQVEIVNFTAAQAGDAKTPSGKNGSFTYKIRLSSGQGNEAYAEETAVVTGVISASPYVSPSDNGDKSESTGSSSGSKSGSTGSSSGSKSTGSSAGNAGGHSAVKRSVSPKTGDPAPVGLYLLLAATALAGGAGVLITRKKKTFR